MGASRGGASKQDAQYVRQALAARGGPQVPHNFAQTAPGHDGTARKGRMPQSSPRSSQVGDPADVQTTLQPLEDLLSLRCHARLLEV